MLYEFRSDCREGLDYMEKAFHRVLENARAKGLDVACKVIGMRPCAGDVDAERQAALTERGMRIVEAVTGARPEENAGSTDCNIPLSMGIPSVCIGNYRGFGAHTREEYVEISSLAEGYRVAFEMVLGGYRL